MQILLTDSAEIYEQSNSDKILTDGFVIVNSTIFDHEQTAHFNAQLNGVENEASRLMIEELESVCENFPDFKTNVFLETRDSTYDKAYSLLYADFKENITKKYLIELLLKNLIKVLPVHSNFKLNFTEKFQSIRYSNFIAGNRELIIRKDKKKKHNRFIRSLFYRWKETTRKINSERRKFNIVLFLFDTANDIDLFRTFFDLVKNDKSVYLNIVQIESGIDPEKAVSAKPYESENIHVYKLQEFRSPMKKGLKAFYAILKNYYPEYSHFIGSQNGLSMETYSAFIFAALKELNPQVTLYDNTGEVGRNVSDVARYLNIPSTNVEYGLFSNDFMHMASNISYDVRFCLGEESINTWKSKKDPTPVHIPIGFLKLDHIEECATYDFGFLKSFDKIIFFASTWSGSNSLYNLEKTIITKELSELCCQNNWALIIKKHPAETDKLIDKLDIVKQPHVFLFQHSDIKLFSILEISDIICTQNSSITAEGLMFQKPTIFYNKSEQSGLAKLIPMSKEPFVYFVNNKEQFEEIAKNKIPELDKSVFENSLTRYLYKTDQKASFRLLEELKKLCQ